ncbi:hypothetical protein EF879_19395 [Micromonospora sp. HM5-17]|nr:hypothetical protein EF879_19395 [Micromonospora sp. HM5-17]
MDSARNTGRSMPPGSRPYHLDRGEPGGGGRLAGQRGGRGAGCDRPGGGGGDRCQQASISASNSTRVNSSSR